MTQTETKKTRTGWRGAWIPACIAIVALTFFTSFFPIAESNDDWWHLKAGRLLWEGEMGWYSPDLFTESAKDKVWVNHEWLAEILFHLSVLVGGLRGAILMKSLTLVAVFLMVWLTAFRWVQSLNRGAGTGFHLAALLAVALAIPSSQFTFYLRPPIFTFLFLAVYHHFFLLRQGACPTFREGAFLSALMVLWANLHGGAILGCVVVFLMWIGACLDFLFAQGDRTPKRIRSIKGWMAFGTALGVASLINPYGIHLHLLTFEMMSQKWLTERITEMLPPRIDYIWTLPLLLVPAAWGVFRGGGWGSRLVFLFLLWQGLSHVRHLPLLSIWAAPYACLAFAHRVRKPGPTLLVGVLAVPWLVWTNTRLQIVPHTLLAQEGFRLLVVFALAGTAVAAMLGSAGNAPPDPSGKVAVGKGGRSSRAKSAVFLTACSIAIGYVVVYPGVRPQQFLQAIRGVEWDRGSYPDRLVDLLIEYDIPATVLLNRENHSGYLIWRLAPEHGRTFTCNRFDLQGSLPRMELETLLWCVDQPWVDERSGIEVRPWRELWDEKYSFDAVLLERYSDRAEPFPFPLWEYLDDPASGYVRIASETYPGQPFPDQVFSLFVRKGPHIERIMRELGNRPLLRDSPSQSVPHPPDTDG